MVKLNKIYTRTGDGGERRAGRRLADPQGRARDGQAIGDVDEANSAIGVALLALD